MSTHESRTAPTAEPAHSEYHGTIAIFTSGTQVLPESELAARFDRVLIIGLGRHGSKTSVSVRRYVGGKVVESAAREFPGRTEPLIVAYLLNLIDQSAGPVSALVYHAPLDLPIVRRVVLRAEIDYIVAFPEVIPVSWKEWSFLNSALARLVKDTAAASEWNRKYIFNCEVCDLESGPDTAAFAQKAFRPRFVPASLKTQPANSVLLISYYMPPALSVAVNRIEYWRHTLPELAAQSGLSLDVDVVTATNSHLTRNQYFVVEDRGLDHPTGHSRRELIADLERLRLNHVGATWSAYVMESGLLSRGYDAAVITGNPFYYFDLAATLKGTGCKVFLDFRDPFSRNPRFKYLDGQQHYLLNLEREYTKCADGIFSVNQFCLDLIEAEAGSGTVIANGYDEKVIDAISPVRVETGGAHLQFIYAGTLMHDRSPKHFLSALNPECHRLVHIGRSDSAQIGHDCAAYLNIGPFPYGRTISHVKAADAGVIFTSGMPFEQTTKIFDYIACDIDIVIVTEGDPETGELHNLTRDLPGVYWVRNQQDSIARFLTGYRPERRVRERRQRFSRREQARKLLGTLGIV